MCRKVIMWLVIKYDRDIKTLTVSDSAWQLLYVYEYIFVWFCVSTWLTISFQSLMRVRVRLLLSVYSVRLKVAAAPHKSSSLSASLIVTSAWARLFRSYKHIHTFTQLLWWVEKGKMLIYYIQAKFLITYCMWICM